MVVTAKPLIYYLQITPTCQQHCAGCTNSFKNSRPIDQRDRSALGMSFADWQDLLTKKIKPHAGSVIFTGGEPTLHPQFGEFLDLVKELEIPFSILTNGFWSKPQWLVEKLQNSPNFINLHISLHGSNAKDHESFTLTPNSFHKIIDNIKLATRMKLPVSTGTVITRWNYSKSSEIVTLCEELEVGLVNFNRFIGMDWVGVSASAEQVVYCLRDIQKLKDLGKNIEISTCIPKCFESSATKRCLAGFASCSIDPWGNVTPCIHTNMMVGSLLVNTIDDIWNSIFFQKWRNLTNKDCICCSLLEICGGGCKADIFSSTKSTDFVVSPTSDNRAELPVEFTFLSMPANAKIRAVFKITKSNNGYVLYKGSKLLSVKTEVVQILEAIKDRRLCDVEKEWGQTILSIVGKLFDDGLVELEQEEK